MGIIFFYDISPIFLLVSLFLFVRKLINTFFIIAFEFVQRVFIRSGD
jgi:hypothetical protein